MSSLKAGSKTYLRLPLGVTLLEHGFSMRAILIGDDAGNWRLWPVGLSESSSTSIAAGGRAPLGHVALALVNDFQVVVGAHRAVSLKCSQGVVGD